MSQLLRAITPPVDGQPKTVQPFLEYSARSVQRWTSDLSAAADLSARPGRWWDALLSSSHFPMRYWEKRVLCMSGRMEEGGIVQERFPRG
jgi:hypothetical protein